jgi:transcriptional regulator with XRE-family HTH domain
MANHWDKIVVKNILSIRQKQGFTHNQITGFLEITPDELTEFERGNKPIPISLLSLLANLYGVDKYDFYEEKLASEIAIPEFNFTVESIPVSDLEQIASFKKIIRNYLKMSALLEGSQH